MRKDNLEQGVLIDTRGCLGLIIPGKTGFIYTNQSNGTGCAHPRMEGIFIPLEDGNNTLSEKLCDFFQENRFDENTISILNLILAERTQYGFPTATSWLEVDAGAIDESMEAWLYVKTKLVPPHLSWQLISGNPEKVTLADGTYYDTTAIHGPNSSVLDFQVWGLPENTQCVLTWQNSD